MSKKTRSGKEPPAAGLFDSALAGTVAESAQQIWLAGLGAFAKAQQEGGKVFEALVKDGTSLQRKTQAAAGEKLAEAARVADEAGARAGQQWDKLETIFEQRVAKAMVRLGAPSAAALEALAARVDALAEEVRRLAESRSGAAPRTRPKAASDKPPVKPARKPATRKAD